MRKLILVVALVVGSPVGAQERGAVLKGGNAALGQTADGKILVAWVASGQQGAKDSEEIWSEVRVMEVESAKARVLLRSVSPANLPGIGANHSLLGFSADAKTLTVRILSIDGRPSDFLVDVATANKQPCPVIQEKGKNRKVSPARLKGMKDALADLEKGHLKQKEFPLPSPAWYGNFLDLAQKECGIEFINVDCNDVLTEEGQPRAEIDTYNAVMNLEIEHRHGAGVLDRLHKKAHDDYFKNK